MPLPTTRAGTLTLGTLSADSTILVEIDGDAARANRSELQAYVGAAGHYASYNALVTANANGDLDYMADGDVVSYSQNGYTASFYRSIGATSIPGLFDLLPLGDVTSLHFGAGLGTTSATNNTAAIQAMINYVTSRGETAHFLGNVYLHSTVTINGVPRMQGTWGSRIICVDGNYPAFTVVTTGTATGMEVLGIRASCSATSVNTGNGFMRFTGANTALLQRGRVEGNHLSNFFYGFNYDMDPRTSAFGLEGGVNWMDFSDNHFLNIYRAHLVKNGSGTGNSYSDEKPAIRPGGAYYEVLPETAGTVMGDLIFKGIHGNGSGGAATFIRAGTGTVYGSQVVIIGNQFDANMTIPIDLPIDYTFENWSVDNNNWGGGSRLGLNLEPLRSSYVVDRDYSGWLSGNVKSNGTVGAQNEPLFDVYIPAGGVMVDVEIFSGADYAVGQYWVTYNAAGAVVTQRNKERSSTAAGALDISFISVTDTIARVRAAFTNVSGTRRMLCNVRGRGESAFKIVRFEAS